MLSLLEISAPASSSTAVLVLVPVLVLVVAAKLSNTCTLRVRAICPSTCCVWPVVPSLRVVVRRKRDTVPSLPMISDLSFSPEAAADEREIMDTTMNSVEAKEESRQRGDSMAGESADEKGKKLVALCVAWGQSILRRGAR